MKHLLFTLLLLTACSLFALEVDWSKAKPVQTGALLLKFELSEPRLEKINLMRIDLRTPGLTFTGTARDPDWGKPMPDYPKGIIRTKRIRTRDFMLNYRKQGLNMIVAANSAPWSPWQKPFTHQYANPAGLGILDGEVICDRRPHRAVFRVDRDGRVDIVESVPEQEYSKIRVAASGFAIILRNGEILAGRNYEKDPMPRIAYGLSKDRHYFYILTVDGRQKGWSLGATGRGTCNHAARCRSGRCDQHGWRRLRHPLLLGRGETDSGHRQPPHRKRVPAPGRLEHRNLS